MEELDESLISASFSSDSRDSSLEDGLQDVKFGLNNKKKEISLLMDRSRMSHEFDFKKGIMSSTLLDVEVGNSSKADNETNLSMITPRKVKARVLSSSSSSDSIEVVSNSDNDIIELTSEDESLTSLPDKGRAIRDRDTVLQLNQEMEKMSTVGVSKEVGSNSKVANAANLSMITPRKVKARVISSSSSSDSADVSDSDNDIIEGSELESSTLSVPSHPQKKTMNQTTLDSFVVNKKFESPQVVVTEEQDVVINTIDVTPKEMLVQKGKVGKLEMELQKLKNMLRTVNLNSLPDKGQTIRDRHAAFELQLNQEMEKLSKMVVSKEDPPEVAKEKVRSWDEIQAAADAVVPRTFGKRAVGTYNAQKAVTMDRLQHLHESLKSCPNEHTLADDPAGLTVEMMPHQKRALAWLLWREKEKPSGGILADDMGLGKTLTMISVIAKSIEVEGRPSDVDSASNKYLGGTLVVCPASILHQWSGELEKRTKRGLLSCELYHGPKRETKAKKLAMYDMVVTTYAIVLNECERNGAVFRVKWRRIILDEAHQIRNYKSQSSEAACRLSAQSRWALTGTPVHNKELDMYALLKFLRCTPFDDLAVWKRWVTDKSTGGQERLHTVISSLMLRRTKVELMEKGALRSMPERKWELKAVELDKAEMDVYQKILLFSRTLFAQFLHQRAEKNQDAIDSRYQNLGSQPNKPNQEYFKMRDKLLRFHRVRDIKQHEILVLLLRLRQICCHPSLITSMLREDMEDLGGDENVDETNLIDQLNKLVLNDDEYDANRSDPAAGLSNQENAAGLSEVAKSILNPSNPVFSKETISSKIKVVLDVLEERVMDTDDKAIIVSQWPSFLRLIAYHLKRHHIPFDQLDGSIPVNKRMIMIDKFNNPADKMKVLLLSLTAGGVGLNLVGANHLFLLDLHWNPQLENQAQDRIYRVGQQKPVFVYKFMATDTIEKRILDLQEKKLDIANSMLTGTKQAITNKLSLEDLKLLFEM